jgi:ribosomal protein L11 methylase PrmA
MDFITFYILLLAVLLIIINGLALWWLLMLLLPYLHFGGPYVPTSTERVKLMVQKADLTKDDIVVDLGSGDGRIVIEAARVGVKKAVGYEIHSGLVKTAKLKAKKQGVAQRTEFLKRDFWKEDLSPYSVVFMFQIPFAMKRLSEKLNRELKPGVRIISNGYKIPGLTLVNDDHEIYLYKK